MDVLSLKPGYGYFPKGDPLPRTTPPFRADHVESLLRPPELLRAREGFAAGRVTADDLRAAEDGAIREVVRMQEELGL